MSATATLDRRTGSTPRSEQSVRWMKRLRRAPLNLLVLVLLVFEIYPLIWLFLGSLKTQDEILNDSIWSLPAGLHWENYVDAWTTGNMGTYIRNTIVVVIPSLFFIIVLGVAAGFVLEVMVFKGRFGILLAFLLGIMIPGQMILLPLFSVYFQIGLTGTLLPLIITYIATGLPLTVFMMATYFKAVPREVFEAASMDGATMIQSGSSL